mgnify:FL=1
MYKIIMITLTAVIVALYLIRFLGNRYYQKRLLNCVQRCDLDGFLKMENKRAVRALIPAFNLHYMKLNIFLMRKDEQRTDEEFDVLLDMKVGKTMRRDAVLKAFYYYVKRRDGGRTRKLIAEIRGFQDAEDTIRECEMLFDIYILGRSNHMEELLKDLDTLPPQQRAVHEYLLSLQYENRGEKERAREYEDRSVKTLKDALEAEKKRREEKQKETAEK